MATATRADLDALVREHLPLTTYLVHEIAARLPAHASLDDLLAAAEEGLVQAARSWDPTRGIPFDRFARARMRGAILDELRSIDWASRSVRRRAREVNLVREELAARLGRTATDGEVAGAAGVALADVRRTMADVHRSVVLNLDSIAVDGTDGDRGPVRGGLTEIVLSDDPGPEARYLDGERARILAAAIDALPERHRTVVVAVYYDGTPLADLAATLGVTESRVSQIRKEALALMRRAMAELLDGAAPPARGERGVPRAYAAYADRLRDGVPR